MPAPPLRWSCILREPTSTTRSTRIERTCWQAVAMTRGRKSMMKPGFTPVPSTRTPVSRARRAGVAVLRARPPLGGGGDAGAAAGPGRLPQVQPRLGRMGVDGADDLDLGAGQAEPPHPPAPGAAHLGCGA